MTHDHSSQRHIVMLVLSFGLTVLSFLASRAISEYQAHGVRDAARAISEVTVPANDALATVRTELRRTETILDDLTEAQPVPQQDSQGLQALERARDGTRRSWGAYVSLPVFPGEQDLIDRTQVNLRDMNTSVATVLRLREAGDWQRARKEFVDRTRAAVVRADEGASASAALNRQHAADQANRISELRSASRTWGFAMDGASAVLAALSVFFMSRVLRRFWRLLEERIHDLELFAGRVAHDIRSPLNTVSFALELARQKPETTPATQSILDRGIRTLQQIGQLVDGLLVFARSGVPSPEEGGANVADVVAGVVDGARPSAQKKEITLDYEASPCPPLAVACSRGVLASMTLNLVDNAIKYMGDTPVRKVSVRAREVGRSVRIEVGDTGPGIPPTLRARIFDLYVRGAGTALPGLGLGLATVRRLAEAHGGSVGVHPNRDGGSLFWFDLPKWKEKEKEKERGSTLRAIKNQVRSETARPA